MVNKYIAFTLDKLNQSRVVYSAKTITTKFTKKVVYKDQALNQKVLDFGTLFSSFNFPIIVEFEQDTEEYYSFNALKEYLEALSKAKKERSFDRAIDDAVSDAYVYLLNFVKTCEYLKKFYEDAFEDSIDTFNKSFGFSLMSQKQLPRLLLHLAFFDPDKKNIPVKYDSGVNVFDVYPVIFSIDKKYYPALFSKEIAKLLVMDPMYMVKVGDLKQILKSIEYLQNFRKFVVEDIKYFFNMYLKYLKKLEQSIPKYSKVIALHLKKLNKVISSVVESGEDYKKLNVALNKFVKLIEKEFKFLTVLSDKSNEVMAYQLKNKVKEMLEHKESLLIYSSALLKYDATTKLVMKSFLGKFYLVFLKVYSVAYRKPSLHLERFKDKNIDVVYKFYKSRNDLWKDIFVTTKSLEEVNRVSKKIYTFHTFLSSFKL